MESSDRLTVIRTRTSMPTRATVLLLVAAAETTLAVDAPGPWGGTTRLDALDCEFLSLDRLHPFSETGWPDDDGAAGFNPGTASSGTDVGNP